MNSKGGSTKRKHDSLITKLAGAVPVGGRTDEQMRFLEVLKKRNQALADDDDEEEAAARAARLERENAATARYAKAGGGGNTYGKKTARGVYDSSPKRQYDSDDDKDEDGF